MSFFDELKRRNVVRVAIAYAIVSWVVLQIIDVISPILGLPEWAPKLVFVILAVGAIPALIFSWAFELTPDGLKKETEVDRSQSITATTGQKLNYVIFAALALAIGLLLFERQITRGDATSTDQAEVVATAELEPSIAVLPFVNMTSDPEQEFFSDGISEEILNSLAAVQELKVAGRTSSFAFKGDNQDLRIIGEALGVNHILEGSVRKSGDQVRITAQLIRADNGFHLWSETYDRELNDVFAIQDDIAAKILQELKLHLLDGETVLADADRTTPEAYEIYLRARQRIYGRIGSEIEKAVDELDYVIQLDPEYAPAFAQRGIATMLLAEDQYGSIPLQEAMRRGKRFVDLSLTLNPNLAYGWAGLGLYHANFPTQSDQAIEALTRALELNPNLVDAGNWLNNTLRDAGDAAGALEVIAELAERDPFYRPAFGNAILGFNMFGQMDRAEELLDRMAQLDPDSPDILMGRSINLMYSGQLGEGLRVMEERAKLGSMSGVARVYLAIGYNRTGQFQRTIEDGHHFNHVLALYELGRVDDAYQLAHDAAEAGFPADLFYLYLRDQQPKSITDYVEERWPTIELFGKDNVGSEFGYDTMNHLAFAYKLQGQTTELSRALILLSEHNDYMLEQGVNNLGLSQALAFQHALDDDFDTALEWVRKTVDQGESTHGPAAEVFPTYALLAGDPRFAELEDAMRETYNRDRAVVGLPPVDENYNVIETTDAESL